MSVRETVRIAPPWVYQFLATVVETVLALWRTVQVNDDFDSGLARPSDGLIQVGCCALGEGPPRFHVGPVADRDADNVKAGVADLLKVLERNEGVPVGFERIVAGLLAELFAEGPFVDDGPVRSTVGLEDGGCDESVPVC